MAQRYLEVTYRNGRPHAAYLYLPRPPGVKSVRTVRVAEGLVVDYGPGGEAIGIEITSPEHVRPADINDLLRRLGQPALGQEELASLPVG